MFGEDSGDKTAPKEKADFGSHVSNQLQHRAGTSETLEATMLLAPLTKDQFELLEIDSSGFNLHLQQRPVRFELISYEYDENVVLVLSKGNRLFKSPLFCELLLLESVVLTRYQVNVAKKRPDKDATDSSRLA